MTEEDTSWHEGHNQWLRGYNARVDEERARRAEAMVYVCPRKDIVCGSRPENWCIECPLRSQGASGLSPEALDSDEKENPGVGVRVGATPELLTAAFTGAVEALIHAARLVNDDDDMPAMDALDRAREKVYRAALRAPEPLTAEPVAWRCTAPGSDKPALLERDIGLAPFGWLVEPLYLGAALEGGVSPQQGWNEGFVKGHAMASEIRDIGEALVAARAKFGLEGGVHQTESAGEAVQRPAFPVPASWDTRALSTAQKIALMWGQDRSQFVSKIQVAVLDAMRWAGYGNFTDTQRSTQPQGSDKTEGEGGVSRTEPALTDEQIDKITYAVGLWERPPIWDDMDKMRRFARALLIATKSHPSGDQGL